MSRDLTGLHPTFRANVLGWKAKVKGLLGRELLIFTTFRGAEEQAMEKAAGKSKASPWQSAHQYGLGVDVVVLEAGKAIWSLSGKEWEKIGTVALSFGIDYPATRDLWMRRVDPYHFQDPGFRLWGAKTLLDRLRNGIDLLNVGSDSPWTPPVSSEDLAIKAPWE